MPKIRDNHYANDNFTKSSKSLKNLNFLEICAIHLKTFKNQNIDGGSDQNQNVSLKSSVCINGP